MTPLRAKMIADMQLHRLAPGTQALYLRAMTELVTYYGVTGVISGKFSVRGIATKSLLVTMDNYI